MPRIACVEDTASKAALLERLFAQHGRYQWIGTAGSAAEAWDLLGQEPHIVLVDRILPDADGLELADAIAERVPEARVYLYSSTDPPPLIPGRVGYLRDSEAVHWPKLLDPPRRMKGVMVRHPRRQEAR